MSDDHEDIRSLIYAYAELIDAGDFDGVADLFAHAHIVAANGQRFEGRDTLRVLWANSVRTYDHGSPSVCHLISNVNVRVDNDRTTARARSYVLVMQARPGFPLQPIAVSRHEDQFAKVDGAWRFAERRDHQDLVGDLSRHVFGIEPA
jgi:3-phenylpropionate/cinnamic acid dioxygenase small subunit